MSEVSETGRQRLDYLDSSRGLAAVSVLFMHFFGSYGLFSFMMPLSESTFHIFWNGEAAVAYFYVLSGFVLALPYRDQTRVESISLYSYLTKRAFRIYPLFWACLLVSFLLQKLYLSQLLDLTTEPTRTDYIRGIWQHEQTLLGFLKEAILIIRIPNDPSQRLITQDWTLSIELLVSSIIPIFLVLFARGKGWVILMIAFLVLYQNPAGMEFVIAFLIGVYIAQGKDWLMSFLERTKSLQILLFISGILLYNCTFNFLKDTFIIRYNNHTYRTFILESIGSGMLLLVLLSSTRLRKLFSNNILNFFGRISYGIYVCHFFILMTGVPLLVNYLNGIDIMDHDLVRLLSLIFLLSSTILVSYILHISIENPMIKLGKKLSSGRFFNFTKRKRTPIDL